MKSNHIIISSKTMKTLVVFRDCHASHRIAVRCTDNYDESFVRNFAARKKWPVCVRKEKRD